MSGGRWPSDTRHLTPHTFRFDLRTAIIHTLMSAAIRCSNLVKRYKDVVAVAGLDLEVRAGECFGLLGPNGAGKTTTVEMLEGLVAPDGG